MATKKDKLDAGLANWNHYKNKLPPWRYHFRERLLPIVRTETPYVALLQEYMRSPTLDTYFAMTANLGTHTCFMVVLPILFWCGYPDLGRAMAQMLAAGVFFSGFVKDLLCLPRPLSPPLTRITMSGSAALEYGFPSTHSTNAVSVAVYSILMLRCRASEDPSSTNAVLQGFAYFYAFSIVLGRLYCGMHGFFDVFFGSALGGLIASIQYQYGYSYDTWTLTGTLQNVSISVLIVLVLVRIHPEPADDCPCFDDSVAFAGVMLGIQVGGWHFAHSRHAMPDSYPSTVPFDLQQLGWPKTIGRIVLGVFSIFVWRALMKPTLLRILPPLFRVIETLGLDLPRRFFKPASQYKIIPSQESGDNIIPSAKAIPQLLTNFRRRRAISIGPQSEADAYETLAYREKRRRDSINRGAPTPIPPIIEASQQQRDYFQSTSGSPKTGSHHTTRKRSLSLEEFRAQMGAHMEALSPTAVESSTPVEGRSPLSTSEEDAQREKELFAGIQKPRVRYDVEVVTKLIVYSGIAWLAVEGSPLLFSHLGLAIDF